MPCSSPSELMPWRLIARCPRRAPPANSLRLVDDQLRLLLDERRCLDDLIAAVREQRCRLAGLQGEEAPKASPPAGSQADGTPLEAAPAAAVQREAVTARGHDLQELRAALCGLCGLDPGDFDPHYDVVYATASTSLRRRGEEVYHRPPQGWCKLGLQVAQKYSGQEWLQKREWPVVYHGTSALPEVVRGILREGFKAGGGRVAARHGQRLGAGIYCSPLIDKAMRYADVPLLVCGKPFAVVFQCRVRPKVYNKAAKDVWVVQDTDDIRPCGILLHRFLLPDSQQIRFQFKNPHRRHTKQWDRFRKLQQARTVGEARRLGRDLVGLQKDLKHQRLRLVGPGCCGPGETVAGNAALPKTLFPVLRRLRPAFWPNTAERKQDQEHTVEQVLSRVAVDDGAMPLLGSSEDDQKDNCHPEHIQPKAEAKQPQREENKRKHHKHEDTKGTHRDGKARKEESKKAKDKKCNARDTRKAEKKEKDKKHKQTSRKRRSEESDKTLEKEREEKHCAWLEEEERNPQEVH